MSDKPIFSDRVIAKLRMISVGAWKVIAVGGDTWTIQRWTGDGVTTARTLATVGTITGYIAEQQVVQLVNASAGTSVGQTRWRLALLSGSVQVEDVLTSVADSSWKFTVRALDSDFLFSRADVERVL